MLIRGNASTISGSRRDCGKVRDNAGANLGFPAVSRNEMSDTDAFSPLEIPLLSQASHIRGRAALHGRRVEKYPASVRPDRNEIPREGLR